MTDNCHRDEGKSAAPWLSPGLVRSDETVLRTIFDPHHIEDGKIRNAAISTSDLMKRGLSVDRQSYTSRWRLKLEHWLWRRRYDRKENSEKLEGCFLLPISVSDIRSIQHGGNQTMGVVDWSLWNNPAHAAIILSSPAATQADARRARIAILGNAGPHVPVRQAFGPRDQLGFTRGVVLMLLAPLKNVGRMAKDKLNWFK